MRRMQIAITLLLNPCGAHLDTHLVVDIATFVTGTVVVGYCPNTVSEICRDQAIQMEMLLWWSFANHQRNGTSRSCGWSRLCDQIGKEVAFSKVGFKDLVVAMCAWSDFIQINAIPKKFNFRLGKDQWRSQSSGMSSLAVILM